MSLVARLGVIGLLAVMTSALQTAPMLVISDVTVINPRHTRVVPHQNVLIEGQRVVAVVPASSPVPPNARVVPGEGRFLIPGLWDAHVHLTKAGMLSLPLFVANGVTGVRDMGSDLSEVLNWRARIAAGRIIGPRIKTSGQILESPSNVERMKREMHQEGVPFLAGTDVGVVSMYPGFSLHDELEQLVRHAGFTPMEALAVATHGVPRFYGETAASGAIEPGQAADLVLLDADPVADIRNTTRIHGVALRGRWLDRSELDHLLRDVEKGARADCTMPSEQ